MRGKPRIVVENQSITASTESSPSYLTWKKITKTMFIIPNMKEIYQNHVIINMQTIITMHEKLLISASNKENAKPEASASD